MSNKRTCIQGTFLPTDVWSSILDMVPSVVNHTNTHRRKVAEYEARNPGVVAFRDDWDIVLKDTGAQKTPTRLIFAARLICLDDEFPWTSR